MKTRCHTFYESIAKMHTAKIRGREQQLKVTEPTQMPPVDFSNNERRFKFSNQRLVDGVDKIERRVELGFSRPLPENFALQSMISSAPTAKHARTTTSSSMMAPSIIGADLTGFAKRKNLMDQHLSPNQLHELGIP